MAIGKGTGTTVVFSGGSTWSGQVTGLEIDGAEVPVIDVAHMGTTTFRDKIAGSLQEPPQATITVNFDPATPPPAKGTAATCTITFAGGANTFAGSGFFLSDSISVPLEDKMEATVVFQFDGVTGPAYT